MTQNLAPATTTDPDRDPATASGLRPLYLIRAAFSLVWLTLVITTSASLISTDTPSVIAAVLLVIYPLWDVVATLLERRMTNANARDRIGTINVVLGVAAAVAMLAAVLTTVGAALLVFGLWAFLSGAIQLVVAIRRLGTVGAQWPMIVSGALSVLAGISFAVMSASATSGLSLIAGYAGFGALWFLVSVVALSIRARRVTR